MHVRLTWILAAFVFAFAPWPAAAAGSPVSLVDEGRTVKLANGILAAQISKDTGDVLSLRFKDLELFAPGKGYWSFAESGSKGKPPEHFGGKHAFAVRATPASNGGERAEISCRLGYEGKPGTLPMDVELRYVLVRGAPGLYCYGLWRHAPNYPACGLGEARMAIKLNPAVFDFLSIDANRRLLMATGRDWDQGTTLNVKEARRLTTGTRKGLVEHKYDYSAILADTPAYGWLGTRARVGLWMINPSIEYISGGPTKVELTGHLDGGKSGLPTLLNMWQGSHYGGGAIAVEQGEAWSKVIGPFFLYCNAGADADGLWRDALARAQTEQHAWPYAWMSEPEYPLAAGRGTATGRLVLQDPQAPGAAFSNAWVGLTLPDHPASSAADDDAEFNWQRSGKGYQFWARADAAGNFALPHVRPGTYTLRAFADGVLGEFSRTNISVAAGKETALGSLHWTPVRLGRQLWEIGIPNRTAAEFRHGDHYWQWGLYHEYQKEFPNGIDFIIGKSDWRKDWNFCQPPRIDASGKTKDSTWAIRFDLPQPASGTATLRLAICGARGRGHVWVSVNDQVVGETGELPEDGVMHRDGIRGTWFERDVAFKASLLRPGANVITLRSRGSDWTMGVLYDYLRLEIK